MILMIGISAGIAGLRSMLGAGITPVSASEWCVAGITLAAMVLLNVWGGGILRMVCALVGLVVGYVAAGFAGLLGQFAAVGEAPWIGLPSLSHLSWSFDATLIAPFAIASVAAAMKAAGTIAVCQKTNDADWSQARHAVGHGAACWLTASEPRRRGCSAASASTPRRRWSDLRRPRALRAGRSRSQSAACSCCSDSFPS